MTSTEHLRALLDERGIKWKKHRLDPDYATNWRASNGDLVSATRTSGKKITLFWETAPEQAIAATVGEEHETHICKRCGVAYELSIIDKGFGKPRFCPNCGARRSTND